MRIGLLHTVPGLVPVFDARVRAALTENLGEPAATDVHITHLVQAELLTRALAGDPTVAAATAQACQALVDLGCQAIMVTCSSIGAIAVGLGPTLPVPIIRVDGPMAELAAQTAANTGPGSTITVLATQPSTLGPSGELVTAAANKYPAGNVIVETVLVPGAAAALAAGDRAEHDQLIRQAVQSASQTAAAIVLAQASMADAVTGPNASESASPVPVLTSPETGAAAFADIVAKITKGATA